MMMMRIMKMIVMLVVRNDSENYDKKKQCVS